MTAQAARSTVAGLRWPATVPRWCRGSSRRWTRYASQCSVVTLAELASTCWAGSQFSRRTSSASLQLAGAQMQRGARGARGSTATASCRGASSANSCSLATSRHAGSVMAVKSQSLVAGLHLGRQPRHGGEVPYVVARRPGRGGPGAGAARPRRTRRRPANGDAADHLAGRAAWRAVMWCVPPGAAGARRRSPATWPAAAASDGGREAFQDLIDPLGVRAEDGHELGRWASACHWRAKNALQPQQVGCVAGGEHRQRAEPGTPTAGPGRACPPDRAARTAGRRTPRRTRPAARRSARPARCRPLGRPSPADQLREVPRQRGHVVDRRAPRAGEPGGAGRAGRPR